LEAGVTARDVVERIQQQLGVAWRDTTYRDTYKFGGPESAVTGIATTVFVTLDVIQRSAAAGLNMIIPHEDTFWNDRDDTTIVDRDPLYSLKADLLRKHGMVVFRIHDHMHAQRPDFTYVGSARDVGLESRYETAPGSHRFVIPETTLGRLAADVKRRTGARALRVVGDPAAKVRRIQLGVGYATPPVSQADVDVVISGEQQEADGGFDSPAYVLDAMALGIAKGWIMLGHAVSEEAGMLEMAQWIRGFVPEVPVQLVKAGEPFWVPESRR
jgi:putative NIF3 family GTP cyclohydrolase 1 type 2